ncbi:hypothetical protein OAS21_00190 [Pelagibacteraceae bacterium]|nr:hypothetical protein [Pelagibacteraceae bacterium]
MKKSKNKITNLIQKFLKFFFLNSLYPNFLFLRTFKNFKRKINNDKNFKVFSDGLDKINKYEYKITSQNNEDGIIEYIFENIPNNKYFIEIGFGYYEFNSLNLIQKGWTGKLIDIDVDEAFALKKNLIHNFPKSNIKIINTKVTKNNINELIQSNESNKLIDFLSLDIDSNDYWILKQMELSKVSVLCCEYNHWLGNEKKITIPYDENFQFFDNGIWGASLLAITELLNLKNFSLIAVESSGTNAFFINNKLKKNFEILSPQNSFRSIGRFYNEKKKIEIFNNVQNNKKKLIQI